jgi:hypothetical protein
MSRPVNLGAGACGLLMVGLVVRPTLWTGGNADSPGDSVPTVPRAVVAEVPSRTGPVRYEALSQVELQREAEILWRRAVAIQAQLHRGPTSDEREVLLDQLEDVVERSNRVSALLGN